MNIPKKEATRRISPSGAKTKEKDSNENSIHNSVSPLNQLKRNQNDINNNRRSTSNTAESEDDQPKTAETSIPLSKRRRKATLSEGETLNEDEESETAQSSEEDQVMNPGAETELSSDEDPNPIRYNENDLRESNKHTKLVNSVKIRNLQQKELREHRLNNLFESYTNGHQEPYIDPNKFNERSKSADTSSQLIEQNRLRKRTTRLQAIKAKEIEQADAEEAQRQYEIGNRKVHFDPSTIDPSLSNNNSNLTSTDHNKPSKPLMYHETNGNSNNVNKPTNIRKKKKQIEQQHEDDATPSAINKKRMKKRLSNSDNDNYDDDSEESSSDSDENEQNNNNNGNDYNQQLSSIFHLNTSTEYSGIVDALLCETADILNDQTILSRIHPEGVVIHISRNSEEFVQVNERLLDNGIMKYHKTLCIWLEGTQYIVLNIHSSTKVVLDRYDPFCGQSSHHSLDRASIVRIAQEGLKPDDTFASHLYPMESIECSTNNNIKLVCFVSEQTIEKHKKDAIEMYADSLPQLMIPIIDLTNEQDLSDLKEHCPERWSDHPTTYRENNGELFEKYFKGNVKDFLHKIKGDGFRGLQTHDLIGPIETWHQRNQKELHVQPIKYRLLSISREYLRVALNKALRDVRTNDQTPFFFPILYDAHFISILYIKMNNEQWQLYLFDPLGQSHFNRDVYAALLECDTVNRSNLIDLSTRRLQTDDDSCALWCYQFISSLSRYLCRSIAPRNIQIWYSEFSDKTTFKRLEEAFMMEILPYMHEKVLERLGADHPTSK